MMPHLKTLKGVFSFVSGNLKQMNRVYMHGIFLFNAKNDYINSNKNNLMYLFRIYGSEDYVKNRATVFHSSFLLACQPRQSVTSVPIGHYVLPPDFVQNGERS